MPSELEGAVLGVIWRREPVTRYAVRAEFARSRSTHWSGSAGAIYPLLDRLARRGLLGVEAVPGDPRRGRHCRLTPAGRAALRRWLGPEVEDWMAAVTFDPLRTRVGLLEALSPARRRAFVTAALRELEREQAAVRGLAGRLRRAGDHFGALAAEGAAAEIGARRAWMRRIRGRLVPGRTSRSRRPAPRSRPAARASAGGARAHRTRTMRPVAVPRVAERRAK